MRLDKFLAGAGIGTRSEVKNDIKKGFVTVNGQFCKDSAFKLDENKDSVCYKDKSISFCKERYYMLHKPAGYVCATKDNVNKTVLELFEKNLQKRLIIVGRLDKDTEGLLLLTTDGAFSHKLMSPKNHVEKVYYFEAAGSLLENAQKKLQDGISIGADEPLTLPAKFEIIDQNSQILSGCLTIIEGRFDQVKRMLKALGCQVTYLKRISIGSISLDETLALGQYRELSQEEVRGLR